MTNTNDGDRLTRVEAILESLAERQVAFQQEMDANHEYIGSELGQLTRGLVDLRQSVAALVQNSEQDRNQAAIDRAEFRSTVERLLEVLVDRFTSNGHGNG